MIPTWQLITPDLPLVASLAEAKTKAEAVAAIDRALARMDSWPRRPPVTAFYALKAQLTAAKADPLRPVVGDPGSKLTVVLAQKFADQAVEAAKGEYAEAAARRALTEAAVYTFAVGPAGVVYALRELGEAARPAWEEFTDKLGAGVDRIWWLGGAVATVVLVGLVWRR